SGEATIFRKSVNASFAPKALSAASAVSERVVQTAVNSTSGLASSAGKCDWEAQVERTLAPTNPRRILSAMMHAPQRGDVLYDASARTCRCQSRADRMTRGALKSRKPDLMRQATRGGGLNPAPHTSYMFT